ncbi:YciI family protein [Rubrivivax sp. A210]|uniref:YciI family protein n=1 Tax=Rubrivivax sp. A210 TaxID=2772301 RepID=UPI00191B0798|nr:hypothetical protein [Rubrivivax sp. A210]
MIFSLIRRSVTAACLLTVLGTVYGQSSIAGESGKVAKPMKDVRFVVLHTPGPKWLAGKTLFEQPGVREHVEHYRKFLEAGKLALGGPHLDGMGGGMMIPTAGVSEEEVTKYAAEDPAVKSGVLLAEVRPWLIGMSQ